jgi:ribonuclease HI
LVYTHGICENEGEPDARAGCAVIYKRSLKGADMRFVPAGTYDLDGTCFFRLENVSARVAKIAPTDLWLYNPGEVEPSSIRAELRAVVFALEKMNYASGDSFTNSEVRRYWQKSKPSRLVIATVSEYVVQGMTQMCRVWETKGWKYEGEPIRDQDLWLLAIQAVRALKEWCSVDVLFWQITHFQNVADGTAHYACRMPDREKWGVPAPGGALALVDTSQMRREDSINTLRLPGDVTDLPPYLGPSFRNVDAMTD